MRKSERGRRGLAPVLALALAAGLLAGCSQSGGDASAADTEAAGEAAGTENEDTQAAGTEAAGSEASEGDGAESARDTLIIATANETPSVTTNLRNAVAGNYLNTMTHEPGAGSGGEL